MWLSSRCRFSGPRSLITWCTTIITYFIVPNRVLLDCCVQIILFAITAAVHSGTILNALALIMAGGTPGAIVMVVLTPEAIAIFAGIIIELAGLVSDKRHTSI